MFSVRLRMMILLTCLGLAACGHEDEPKATPPETPDGPLLTDGDTSPEGEPARFHGYLATEERLNERLADPENELLLTIFLMGYRSEFMPAVGQLLGYQSGEGLEADFRNGDANGVNMLLWNLIFTSVANDLASLCGDPESLSSGWQPQANLKQIITQRLCHWPDKSARNQEALVSFWVEVMHYDAPPEEFYAFANYFLGPAYAQASPEDFIRDATLAVLMNPYFMLRN